VINVTSHHLIMKLITGSQNQFVMQ